uniref:Uncharacterized protein n=1 Tax=Arundo donax TaxID=35708 RepID=A0A0A9HRK7_ARUDO
MASSVAGGRGP